MMQNLQAGIRDQPPATEAPAPARAPRKKKEIVEHIEPESDSDSTSDSGSESDYEEVNKIKSYFEQQPCEAISPAALGQTKTKKEALDYLKSKNCPKIPNIKKSAKSIKMESGPASLASPAPEVPTKKRVAKPKAAAAPVPAPAAPVPTAPEPVPELKVVKKRTPKVKAPEAAAPAAAPSQGTPLASAPTAPEKKKRAPSAYASLVGKLVKEKKMSFAEAAKAAKAELDAKKKKD